MPSDWKKLEWYWWYASARKKGNRAESTTHTTFHTSPSEGEPPRSSIPYALARATAAKRGESRPPGMPIMERYLERRVYEGVSEWRQREESDRQCGLRTNSGRVCHVCVRSGGDVY
eukprot:scaffold6625_cov146-Isochrysis_galbana.AAC.5